MEITIGGLVILGQTVEVDPLEEEDPLEVVTEVEEADATDKQSYENDNEKTNYLINNSDDWNSVGSECTKCNRGI